MILDSTFYKNISRKVISGGTTLVFPTDQILLCDTSTGAITIQLAEIPLDRWNTVYKLFIVDSAGQASTNNITINAPVGFLVNGQPSVTLNIDNDTFLIRIVNNTNYLSVSNYGGGGGSLTVEDQGIVVSATTQVIDFVGIQASLTAPNEVRVNNAFISGTIASISALATAGQLISNQWYNITNALYGYFAHSFNIYIPALTKKGLSSFGIGEFYNADYAKVGDYSGIVGFAGNLGIWQSTLITAANSVVIWDNKHYKNISGLNGITVPSSDLVNWQVLPYSNTNGYIVVYDQITIDSSFRIIYRKDKNNNEVEWYDVGITGSFDNFPFGNPQVKNNKVIQSSYWELCNTIINKEVRDNFISNADLQFQVNNDPFFIGVFSKNKVFGTVRPLEWNKGSLALIILSNQFIVCQGQSTMNDANISSNNFVIASLTLNVSGNTSIFQNQIFSSSISMTKTHANFDNNTLFQSNWLISNSSGIESNNYVSASQIIMLNNEGTFKYNHIVQSSTLQINNISVAGFFNYNTLNFKTTFNILNLNNANFGDGGVKGVGNEFSDCNFSIQDFVGSMYANKCQGLQLNIVTFSGSIAQCNFTNTSQIFINDMNGHTITFLTCQEFILGSGGWNMYESFNGGMYNYGIGSVKCSIDCSDPLIYDLATNTLIIPNELRKWAGIYTLTNANGLLITRITNTYDKAPYKFLNDNGTTDFKTTAVGLALGGDLISSSPAGTVFTINFRVDGSDFIVCSRSGLFMAITETAIFV